MLVAFFATMTNATWTPPAGMTERGELIGTASGKYSSTTGDDAFRAAVRERRQPRRDHLQGRQQRGPPHRPARQRGDPRARPPALDRRDTAAVPSATGEPEHPASNEGQSATAQRARRIVGLGTVSPRWSSSDKSRDRFGGCPSSRVLLALDEVPHDRVKGRPIGCIIGRPHVPELGCQVIGNDTTDIGLIELASEEYSMLDDPVVRPRDPVPVAALPAFRDDQEGTQLILHRHDTKGSEFRRESVRRKCQCTAVGHVHAQ